MSDDLLDTVLSTVICIILWCKLLSTSVTPKRPRSLTSLAEQVSFGHTS